MTEHKVPTILVTNDDGIYAPGIRFLTSIAEAYGDVVVVAPLEGMSGMGHAITIKTPLRYKNISHNGSSRLIAVNGTPVDCVKIALRKILNKKPDLILSGINHGSNASVNTIYSGTMAAAFEGAMAGIPSIGFSLMDYSHKAPLDHLTPWLMTIIEDTLKKGLPQNVCLNVNFPSVEPPEEIRGIKLCRQAIGYWKEAFEERKDPHEQPYFWLTGDFVPLDHGTDTDLYALEQKWISLVPVHFDFTAFQALSHFHTWSHVEPQIINPPNHETAAKE